MLKKLIIVGLSLVFRVSAQGETLVVGLPEPGRMPFFWYDQAKGYQGVYVDLLNRVSGMAGFTIEYRMVPQTRLLAEFKTGTIDIEPGISPSWRPTEAENAISRYTNTFMNMDDVLVVKKGMVAPVIANTADLVNLKGLQVGQVRGFFVPQGLDVTECKDERSIGQNVHFGRLDVGLMNADVARWYKSTLHFNYQITAPFASTPVAFRLHVRQEKWLEPINRVLSDLRKSGELQRILEGKRK